MATRGGGDERETEVLERRWGWRACDRCGETILLGEKTLRVRLGESTREVCLGCGALRDQPGPPPEPAPTPSCSRV